MMMKLVQTSLDKTPNKRRKKKKRTKKEDPSMSQKNKTKSESIKDKGTNDVSKPPLVVRSISKKERDEKLKRVVILEKNSLATTMHLKIEAA
jgi:hypothetical protein